MTAKEEELAAEKLKALGVVQSVLRASLRGPANKGPAAAAKKFKYDLCSVPSHPAFLCHKCLLKLSLKLGHFKFPGEGNGNSIRPLKIYLPLIQ